MSSSDQSDDGIYQSDEEITSFLHMRNSSSDETGEEQEEHTSTRRDSGCGSMALSKTLSNKPNLRFPNPSESNSTGKDKPAMQLKDSLLSLPKSKAMLGERKGVKLPIGKEASKMTSQNFFQCQMFEFGNVMESVTSNIRLRLLKSMKRNLAVAYLSPSYMKDWANPSEVPPNVICDVCLFSDTQPVFLLTFHRGGETREILRYNATVTRHIVSKVRKVSLSNFTAIGVVLNESDCSTEERFMSQMQKSESEARHKFVPNWLHMDRARSSKIVEIFLKMGQKCGKEWVDVSESLNDIQENVTSATNEKCLSDTTENGSDGHKVDMKPSKSVGYRNAIEPCNSRKQVTSKTQSKFQFPSSGIWRREEQESSPKLGRVPLMIQSQTSESTNGTMVMAVDLNNSIESIEVG